MDINFKKDCELLFNEIESIEWAQYTDIFSDDFIITDIKNEKVKKMLSKFDDQFLISKFGDFSKVKINKDGSTVIKEYLLWD